MPEGADPVLGPTNLVSTGPPPLRRVSARPTADPERLRQRAVFLRDLAEARALLARTTARTVRAARLRAIRHRPSLET